MANYSIYDETNQRSKTVSVTFLGNILADSTGGLDTSLRYYFRINTSARDTDGEIFQEQLVLDLDELVLNGVKQRRTDIATAYTNINDMVEDVLYDMINGHAADLYSSGVALKAPMAF